MDSPSWPASLGKKQNKTSVHPLVISYQYLPSQGWHSWAPCSSSDFVCLDLVQERHSRGAVREIEYKWDHFSKTWFSLSFPPNWLHLPRYSQESGNMAWCGKGTATHVWRPELGCSKSSQKARNHSTHRTWASQPWTSSTRQREWDTLSQRKRLKGRSNTWCSVTSACRPCMCVLTRTCIHA